MVALYVRRKFALGQPAFAVSFVTVYSIFSVAVVYTAPVFGREPIRCIATESTVFAMQSPLYCALNRRYTSPEARAATQAMARAVDQNYPGTLTQVLDANFPFFDGFPMLPHLSHNDGHKIDIAFYYGDPGTGQYLRKKTKSPIGYWGFERPGPGTKLPCAGRDDWLTGRWNMKWFQFMNSIVALEPERTRFALGWLVAPEGGQKAGVTKVLVEPYLANRLGIQSDILRFQGCRAARHDDHMHFEVK